MNLTLNNLVLRCSNLSWLTGPIFGKELRISSRRCRNYIMRFLYLVILAVFLIVTWVDVVKVGGSSTFTVSRMAEAGHWRCSPWGAGAGLSPGHAFPGVGQHAAGLQRRL